MGDDSTWDDTRTDGESSYGSSTYTDNTPNERSSRRALILQMAKKRMNSVKEASAAEKKKGENDTSLDAPQDELGDEMEGLELD